MKFIFSRAFADALEVIPLTLAENAGMPAINTVTELRNLHAEGNLIFYLYDYNTIRVKYILNLFSYLLQVIKPQDWTWRKEPLQISWMKTLFNPAWWRFQLSVWLLNLLQQSWRLMMLSIPFANYIETCNCTNIAFVSPTTLSKLSVVYNIINFLLTPTMYVIVVFHKLRFQFQMMPSIV